MNYLSLNMLQPAGFQSYKPEQVKMTTPPTFTGTDSAVLLTSTLMLLSSTGEARVAMDNPKGISINQKNAINAQKEQIIEETIKDLQNVLGFSYTSPEHIMILSFIHNNRPAVYEFMDKVENTKSTKEITQALIQLLEKAGMPEEIIQATIEAFDEYKDFQISKNFKRLKTMLLLLLGTCFFAPAISADLRHQLALKKIQKQSKQQV